MRIGVISDTHANEPNTLAAARMLDSLAVEQVLHCGDIGSKAIPKLLARWPVHFVFGNCDTERDELRQAIQAAGLICHGRFGRIELAGRTIALLHSDDGRLFRELQAGSEYDLICYGHTHVAKAELVGKTLVLNPGALHRANPHTLAIVDLATMEATFVPV
ncbi:MAG: YfcE family phosphodiesterase [Pirellulaceae bacterium]